MTGLPLVTATRYVTPLREGGSLPGLVEADDLGLYVAKFTGAGQGPRALVAEVVSAGIADIVGIAVPRLVALDVDPQIGRREPDPEVQDLLLASPGINLGVDFLPGALSLDPMTWPADPAVASAVVWLDCLVENVDRTWRNPNLLLWHGAVWAIDHGASLYFQYSWKSAARHVGRRLDVSDHVLRHAATEVAAADERLAPLVTEQGLVAALDRVPDEWLDDAAFTSPTAQRAAFVEHLLARLARRTQWLP